LASKSKDGNFDNLEELVNHMDENKTISIIDEAQ
jgi:hypothetical protein